MSKHTPGPWVKQDDLTRGRDPIGVLSGDGMEVVAQASSEANARLIAAAPDLLEAAKAMDLDCRADNLNPCYAGRSTDVPGQHWGGGKACAPCTMRAAIAKAEGGDA